MNKLDFDINLFTLSNEKCFRIESILGQSVLETTQLAYIADINGAEHGPFVRKLINKQFSYGNAYSELYYAQVQGATIKQVPYIYFFKETDEAIEVIMEYLEGKTLAELIEGCSTYDERLELTRRYFPELCQAVNELHTKFESPVIHRDLKPSNIIVCTEGVKLLDLGIARIYKAGAESDTIHFGTRPYAPPEQYGFGQTDMRSDIYALGKVLYFCLTAKEPASDVKSDLSQHPEISSALTELIVRATKLDPDARPANAKVLLREANSALNHTGELDSATLKEPFKLVGTVWDILLLICAACAIAGAVDAIRNPTLDNAARPLWYLIYAYFFWIVPCMLIVIYLMSDRRPIHRFFPNLPVKELREECTYGFVVVAVLTLIWIVVTVAVG